MCFRIADVLWEYIREHNSIISALLLADSYFNLGRLLNLGQTW